jgi:hypothetical protein
MLFKVLTKHDKEGGNYKRLLNYIFRDSLYSKALYTYLFV